MLANVEDDLAPETRSSLVGVLEAPPVRIAFPDGETSVDVVVTSARGATRIDGGMTVDMQSEPRYLRAIRIDVADAGGYDITASVVGNPTNVGTVEAPIESRLVQITRRKSGLFGSKMGQMSVRVRPGHAERI